jgi:hypothetical protein
VSLRQRYDRVGIGVARTPQRLETGNGAARLHKADSPTLCMTDRPRLELSGQEWVFVTAAIVAKPEALLAPSRQNP